jgi:hypothetical protein
MLLVLANAKREGAKDPPLGMTLRKRLRALGIPAGV